jgi:DNA-binding transcriptional LysR family regulator
MEELTLKSTDMLQYLGMLLKHGNFTKAARDLHISQPYLTQTIKKVEDELGIEIIDRKIIPLQLTEAGKLYFEYLAKLEHQQDSFKNKLNQLSHPEQKIIKIGILPSLGTYLLPRFLQAYQISHPDVKIDLQEDIPKFNEKKCLNGKIDFFIGQNPETVSPKLVLNTCGLQSYYGVIPKTSPFYQAEHRYIDSLFSLKELLQTPLVLTKRGSAVRRQIDYLLQKYRIEPTIVLESNNIFTIKELAKSGLGTTIVPESVISPFEEGEFNLYPIAKDLLSLGYFIAYSAEKHLAPFEKNFITTFKEKLSSK